MIADEMLAAARSPAFPPLVIGPLLVDPPLLAAPMAGFSNYAYRQVLRGFGGVGLPCTEMLSARGVLGRHARGQVPPQRLWGVREEPRPLAVQIWDNDPETLAEVGRRLAHEFQASVVDINFGCPVRDISEKARSGSYLLRWPDRIGRIVAAAAAACRPVPVTAKIRLGATRDTINAIDVAQAVEGAGGAAVTVHGRTASEFFRGKADWDEIARIRPHLARIPLVGNGDLTSAQSVVEAMRRYGVAGVMIGRAALGRPWLFRQAQAALAGQPIPPDPTPAQQQALLLEHHRLVVERFGPQRGTILMRKFACRYAQGRPAARAFRAAVAHAADAQQFAAALEQFFPH
jgi:tRNA-dihydrouridine synthase B